MTTFQIKLIAIITMAIDHIGVFFFPNILVFRIIGRLSFPLFAWLIANGAYHTRSIKAYALRLFIAALISQFPYLYAFRLVNENFFRFNVIFTLLTGLLCIVIYKKVKNIVISVYIIGLIALFAEFFNFSYGVAGVLSIIAFYIFFKDLKKMLLTQLLIYGGYSLLYLSEAFSLGTFQEVYINLVPLIQPLALVSIIFISLYNGKLGKRVKYFFYIFYPVHLLLIYVIKRLFLI